ncbi:hypothetical protein [Winogradskyella sp.]|uniref:hypothetical protein n=1 Tax=Winogradskyella sp. TaxID=1883156 RepID=UPI002634883B|nr:hypothetical protein [Winogradskyella sp.]
MTKKLIFTIFCCLICSSTIDGGRRSTGKRFGIGFAQGIRPLLKEFGEVNDKTLEKFTDDLQKKIVEKGLNSFDTIVDDAIVEFGSLTKEFSDRLDLTAEGAARQARGAIVGSLTVFSEQMWKVLNGVLVVGVVIVILGFMLKRNGSQKPNLVFTILACLIGGFVSFYAFRLIPNPIKDEALQAINEQKEEFDMAFASYNVAGAKVAGKTLELLQPNVVKDQYNKTHISNKAQIFLELVTNEYLIQNSGPGFSKDDQLIAYESQVFQSGYKDNQLLSLRSFNLFKNPKNKTDEIASMLYAYYILKNREGSGIFEDMIFSILKTVYDIYNEDPHLYSKLIPDVIAKEVRFPTLRDLEIDRSSIETLISEGDDIIPSNIFGHVILFNEEAVKYKRRIDSYYIELLELLAQNITKNQTILFNEENQLESKLEEIKEGVNKVNIEFQESIRENRNAGYRNYTKAAIYLDDTLEKRIYDIINSLNKSQEEQRKVEIDKNEVSRLIKEKAELEESIKSEEESIEGIREFIRLLRKEGDNGAVIAETRRLTKKIDAKNINVGKVSKIDAKLEGIETIKSKMPFIHYKNSENSGLAQWKRNLLEQTIEESILIDKFLELDSINYDKKRSGLVELEKAIVYNIDFFEDNTSSQKKSFENLRGENYLPDFKYNILLEAMIENSIYRKDNNERIYFSYPQISPSIFPTTNSKNQYDAQYESQINDFAF